MLLGPDTPSATYQMNTALSQKAPHYEAQSHNTSRRSKEICRRLDFTEVDLLFILFQKPVITAVKEIKKQSKNTLINIRPA